MALHRPHGDVELVGDLAVAEPPGERREHFGLTFGDTGAGQPLSRSVLGACHAAIVRHWYEGHLGVECTGTDGTVTLGSRVRTAASVAARGVRPRPVR